MRALWIEFAVLLVVGLVGLWEGFGALGRRAFQQEPLTPAAYLMGVAALLCVASVVVSAERAQGSHCHGGGGSRLSRRALGPETGLWAAMLGYALLLPVLGYALATVLFFALAFWVLQVRPWPKAGLTGVLFATVFVLGFVVLANLLLPVRPGGRAHGHGPVGGSCGGPRRWLHRGADPREPGLLLSSAACWARWWGCCRASGRGRHRRCCCRLTFTLPPSGGIIMLAGIYYGAMYGGSTTSILMNVPGEASSVPTCLEGFQMTKKGRAGEALAIAAIGSFIAGTFGTIALSFVGPALASVALRFGPPEYFGLFFLSLTLLVSLSGASVVKGMLAGLVGIFLATVGTDPLSGMARLTFGSTDLRSGFDVIPVLMGVFGVSEVLLSAEEGIVQVYQGKLGRLIPRGQELWKGLKASVRGTLLGFGLGLLPGVLSPVGHLSGLRRGEAPLQAPRGVRHRRDRGRGGPGGGQQLPGPGRLHPPDGAGHPHGANVGHRHGGADGVWAPARVRCCSSSTPISPGRSSPACTSAT